MTLNGGKHEFRWRCDTRSANNTSHNGKHNMRRGLAAYPEPLAAPADEKRSRLSRRESLRLGLATVTATVLAGSDRQGGSKMPYHAHHLYPAPALRVSPATVTPAPAPVAPTSANFTFADDFVGADGSAPSSANWNHITGPGSVVGGNDETETYVKSTENAYLDGQGHLVIAVTAAGSGYRSARLTSKFSQQYGHWEACIAIRNATGCWPAFWFLGNSGSWPGCGECDVMENYGTSFTDGTVWNSTATANQNDISADPSDDNFHIYRMDWVQGGIQLYRDDVLYVTAASKKLSPWPFDTNGGMYAILNIATNGTGTNGVSPSRSAMPVKMLVEYVHAWQ
jgi:beta-glucanase (GH16 family)